MDEKEWRKQYEKLANDLNEGVEWLRALIPKSHRHKVLDVVSDAMLLGTMDGVLYTIQGPKPGDGDVALYVSKLNQSTVKLKWTAAAMAEGARKADLIGSESASQKLPSEPL